MNDVIVHTESLTRDFPMGGQMVHALRDVNLSVAAGEFLCIAGPSGSGKSTLLNLIGGLDRPTQGRVLVAGLDLTALDEDALAAYRRRRVGFVFQHFNLISTMTARQNVELPMIFAGIAPEQRRERAAQLLAQMGLVQRMDHRPSELSGGEQQRVAIARALANEPAIILADEPTGNLDTATGNEVMETLRRLNQAAGRTLVVVSHDPDVAAFAGRVLRMRDGRINVGD